MEEDGRRAAALGPMTGGEDGSPVEAPPATDVGAGDSPVAAPPPCAGATAVAGQRDHGPPDEEMPRVSVSRRQIVTFVLLTLSVLAFLLFVLPKISGPHGLAQTWHHIEHGNEWWVLAGLVFETLSFAGYIALFRAVFVRGYERIGWQESYQITMSGLAASRLFAAGGAGGIALTAWALRRSGMGARVVACRMVAFIVLLYLVYDLALLLTGIGLGVSILPGGGSFAITFVPAIVAALLLAIAAAVAFLPSDVERRLEQWAQGSGRVARWIARAVSVPATAASGVRTAIDLVRSNDPYLLGAPAWWFFDICVLWASFHAFGQPPEFSVIVMAYFVGMFGNLLPLPGGVGGVDGGMIAAFAAFGVPLSLAVVAVLLYRAIAFWLPTIPGAFAYIQLRRTVSRWRVEEIVDPDAPSERLGSQATLA